VRASADSTVTTRIAAYGAAAWHDALPEPVRREAGRAIVNIQGCILGGACYSVVATVDASLAPFAEPPQAMVIGRDRRTNVLHATLINCLASSVYSFDDTH
jgi:2-methylcitrate dehydratase PrpD